MKKFLSCFLLSLLLCGTVWAAPINGDIDGHAIVKVRVNGVEVNSEVPAMLYKDSTLLPLRAVSEALGAKVEWNQDTYSVDVTMPQPTPTATPTPKPEQPKLSQAEIERISKSVARIYVYDQNDKVMGQGTGFVIEHSKQKVLVTNCHVACNGPHLRVEVNGEVIGIRNEVLFKSETTDIFAVKINTTAPALPVQAELPNQGDTVTLIGYPEAQYKVSTGKITGVYDTLKNASVTNYSSDASLTVGSSGAPLFNHKGEVIGVTFAGDDENTMSGSIAIKHVQQELDKPK